jgi:hypothetical protein
VLALLALLVVVFAVVVAAVVVATGSTNGVIHASRVIAHTFQTAYNKVSGLITQYTK